MTIIRKKYHSGYTIIPNTLAEDSSLSWRARGMLLYILCKPDDWVLRTADLIKQGDCRRDAVLNTLKELRRAGYVKLVETRKNGKFRSREYWCSAEPEFKEESQDLPESSFSTSINSTSITSTPYQVSIEPSKDSTKYPKNKVKAHSAKTPHEPYPIEFEFFWSKRPNRSPHPDSKKDAFKAWKARRKQGYPPHQLFFSMMNYKCYVHEQEIEPRYIKQTKTILGPGDHIDQFYEEYQQRTEREDKEMEKSFYQLIENHAQGG